MDLVEPDESNEDEVLSDTLQYIQDFFAQFKNGIVSTPLIDSQVYRVDNVVTCSPFTERFDNNVSGWVGDIRIAVDYTADACDLPL